MTENRSHERTSAECSYLAVPSRFVPTLVGFAREVVANRAAPCGRSVANAEAMAEHSSLLAFRLRLYARGHSSVPAGSRCLPQAQPDHSGLLPDQRRPGRRCLNPVYDWTEPGVVPQASPQA